MGGNQIPLGTLSGYLVKLPVRVSEREPQPEIANINGSYYRYTVS
ncbi:MAG: hypothetical protein N2110_07565 [Flavobacteriales bacterium]|nr:hypothetical protein [Flavobacteriales bacterium]